MLALLLRLLWRADEPPCGRGGEAVVGPTPLAVGDGECGGDSRSGSVARPSLPSVTPDMRNKFSRYAARWGFSAALLAARGGRGVASAGGLSGRRSWAGLAESCRWRSGSGRGPPGARPSVVAGRRGEEPSGSAFAAPAAAHEGGITTMAAATRPDAGLLLAPRCGLGAAFRFAASVRPSGAWLEVVVA